jgi:predicted membrane protein
VFLLAMFAVYFLYPTSGATQTAAVASTSTFLGRTVPLFIIVGVALLVASVVARFRGAGA